MQPDEIVTIQIEKAEQVQQELNRYLDQIKEQRSLLNSNFVKVGCLLSRVRSEKLWIELGYKSFGAYLKTVEEKLDLSRNHLYLYMGVSEDLLDVVGEKNLIDMGVVRARDLRKAMKLSGKEPSDELVAKALDKRVKGAEFESAVQTEYNFDSKLDTDMTWYSMGGFFATDGEREELDRAIKCATLTDPILSKEASEQAKVKDVVLKWVRDYLSAWEHQVEKGIA